MESTHHFPKMCVTVPSDWTDESVITFVAPAKDGLAANVVITSERVDSADWDGAVERELRELKRQAKHYRVVKDEDCEHGGTRARRVEHTFLSPDRIPVRQIQLHVFHAPYLYTASISHADREFEANRGHLERVLGELSFGEA